MHLHKYTYRYDDLISIWFVEFYLNFNILVFSILQEHTFWIMTTKKSSFLGP